MFLKTILEDTLFWLKTRGPWMAASVTLHAVGLAALGLIVVSVPQRDDNDVPAFESPEVDTEVAETPLENFEVGETPLEPTELNTETLTLAEAPSVAQEEQINGSPDEPFEEAGGGMANVADNGLAGLGSFDIRGLGTGPAVKGAGGVGIGAGEGNRMGRGGAGEGFGGRGSGVRKKMLASGGGTKASERAVAAALHWIARHQMPDGRWSLGSYQQMCKDPSCTGKGQKDTDTAATALGLLPFFAAGQTHKSKGPYKDQIYKGLYWLMSQQKQDGDLRGKGGDMYSHGLAAITLCEAYGLSGDKRIGGAAQQAIIFIEKAQGADGGWRYAPVAPFGDTSVVGWQVMAMKSGLMGGLSVTPKSFENAKRFLDSVSNAKEGEGYLKGGKFRYAKEEGNRDFTPVMSAVGLLCNQYLGAKRTDLGMQDGMKFLMNAQPDLNGRNTYYWYYATQVMHNLPGSEWDQWNRKMRKILIETQNKEGCSAGSWDPNKPTKDAWGEPGGRLMMTSLSCLTLEVYYRYLPLYKLDKDEKKMAKDDF
jgi:hypothetical protein